MTCTMKLIAVKLLELMLKKTFYLDVCRQIKNGERVALEYSVWIDYGDGYDGVADNRNRGILPRGYCPQRKIHHKFHYR